MKTIWSISVYEYQQKLFRICTVRLTSNYVICYKIMKAEVLIEEEEEDIHDGKLKVLNISR
jgi:hypothetical protein